MPNERSAISTTLFLLYSELMHTLINRHFVVTILLYFGVVAPLTMIGQKSIRFSKVDYELDAKATYLIRNKKDVEKFIGFYRFENLKALDVRYGNEAVYAKLEECTELESLTLRSLKLDYVPTEIFSLSQLTFLSLQQNPIKILPRGICKCTRLKELVLWDTEIHRFPFCIAELPIRRVDLFGVQMNLFDQNELRDLLPKAQLELEDPCDCDFDD